MMVVIIAVVLVAVVVIIILAVWHNRRKSQDSTTDGSRTPAFSNPMYSSHAAAVSSETSRASNITGGYMDVPAGQNEEGGGYMDVPAGGNDVAADDEEGYADLGSSEKYLDLEAPDMDGIDDEDGMDV